SSQRSELTLMIQTYGYLYTKQPICVEDTLPMSPYENLWNMNHLMASRVLEETNHSTIARVVHDALRVVLWPVQENEGKLLLIVRCGSVYD
ncbi:hypothetical protein L9F63_007758, partial [Diploptera punctata]